MSVLTSVDEGIDILDLPDGWMIAVRDQGLDGIQKTVHIDNGSVHKLLSRLDLKCKMQISPVILDSLFQFP